MFEKTRTYCLGRIQVNLPLEAQLMGQGNKYQGREIDSERMGWPDFQKLVEERRALWKEGSVQRYTFDKEIPIGERGFIFTGRKKNIRSTSCGVETLKWDKLHAFKTFDTAYSPDKIDGLLEEFSTTVRNLRQRDEWDIPTEPGFCIVDGFIPDDEDTTMYESATARFFLKGYPGVWITIRTSLQYRNDPSLLERLKGWDDKFPGKVKRLRKGKATYNDMPGEESLETIPSDDKTGIAHLFIWETPGEIDIPAKPYIQVSITTGGDDSNITLPSPLETKDALKLYEVVMQGLRVRPVERKPEPK